MNTTPGHSTDGFRFECRHRTRTTLGIGLLFVIAASVIGGLAGVLLMTIHGADPATVEPALHSPEGVLIMLPMAAGLACVMAAAVFALVRSVLRSTVIETGTGKVPLNCRATFRSQWKTIVAGGITAILTFGVVWFYLVPLLISRILESAEPGNGIRFRLQQSRKRLAVRAAGIGIPLAAMTFGLQAFLFGNTDQLAETPMDINLIDYAIYIVYVAAATLTATWYLCRSAIDGIAVIRPDPAVEPASPQTKLNSRMVGDRRIKNAGFCLSWVAACAVTFGLVMPFMYSSALKRVLNNSGLPPSQN